jgi:hypothetical protein
MPSIYVLRARRFGSSHAGRLWLHRRQELTCGTRYRREDPRSELMSAGVELGSALIDVFADECNYSDLGASSARERKERGGLHLDG